MSPPRGRARPSKPARRKVQAPRARRRTGRVKARAKPTEYVFVVSHEHAERFEKLSRLLASQPDIRVILDRRQGERRRATPSEDTRRRRGEERRAGRDRRQRQPDLHF